jgi:hypothetical protein
VATKEVERAIIAFLEKLQTVEKVLKSEDAKKWEIAMQEKYDSFVINNIWSLVPLPKGKKPICCKWVFKIKHGSMVKSNVTRLDLWQKVSHKHLESITLKLLQMLQSLCQFVVSLHLRPLKTWRFIKWTSKLHFSMVTLKKKSTWNNPKDSHKEANILCVNFTNHCTT